MLNIPLLMADDGLVRAGLAAEYRFDDARNVMPVGSDNFQTGWAVNSGAVTITQNQVVEEWGTDKATRIQITGGTLSTKYLCTIVNPSISGQTYHQTIKIKNQGLKTVRITNNIGQQISILPGQINTVTMLGIGNGGALRWHFGTETDVSDSLDFIVFQPQASLRPLDQWFPPAGFPQTLTDYVAGSNGTLGSTAWADVNDPTWDGRGLVYVGNHFTRHALPPGFNVANDWTFFVACNVKATNPSVNETFLSLGNSSNITPYIMLFQNTVGNVQVYARNDSSQAAGHSILTPKNDRLLMLRKNGGIITLRDIVSGTVINFSFPEMPITLNQMVFGANGRISYDAFLNGSMYGVLTYNVAIPDSQIPQIYRYMQRLLARRGVTI